MNLVHSQNIIESSHTLIPHIIAILLCVLDTEAEFIDRRVELFHSRKTGSGRGAPPKEGYTDWFSSA